MLNVYLLTVCRLTLGLLFAISFAGKARDPRAFQQAIADFDLLPRRLSAALAALFMAGELAAVLLLGLGGALLVDGLWLALALLLIFSAALAAVLRRRLRVSCNCFGPRAAPVSSYDLWRNAGFAVCALAGLATLRPASAEPAQLGLLSTLLAGLWAATLVTVLINLADIAALVIGDESS